MKDFTPKTRDKKVEFRLYGHEFHCSPMVSADVVLGFMDLMGEVVDDDGKVDETAAKGQIKLVVAAMNKMFEAAIIDPEEYATWERLRDSKTEVIDVETLLAIGSYLGESYASGTSGERPTGESSEDGSSRTSRGKGSKAGAQRKALTTYSRDEPMSSTA